ncbi:hypothetical protein PR048_001099 [Dryococelus australis]|uniref:Uncharacterized protein n=1 Tax=Dryococelus australis TaxID=614101 RepID=A0ABQ9IHD3_9NEOP|nr:hypothetical protein PR048_001099 [Dryococelus australis]
MPAGLRTTVLLRLLPESQGHRFAARSRRPNRSELRASARGIVFWDISHPSLFNVFYQVVMASSGHTTLCESEIDRFEDGVTSDENDEVINDDIVSDTNNDDSEDEYLPSDED